MDRIVTEGEANRFYRKYVAAAPHAKQVLQQLTNAPEAKSYRVPFMYGFYERVKIFLDGAAIAGSFEAGQAAYERRDYATALQLWRPLADQGDAKAQDGLATMYNRGEGVAQDYAKAVKWWRLAADQGLALAQVALGAMYELGDGVPQNYILAHMWYNLAAAQGYRHPIANRDLIARNMTQAQIAEAQRLAREWKPKH